VRRRLLLLSAFSCVLVLLVLAIALGPFVRPRTVEKLDNELRDQILAVAWVVADAPTEQQARDFLATVDTSSHTRIGVLSSTGLVPFGSDADRLRRWLGSGKSISRFPVSPRDFPGVQYPRFFTEPNGDRAASQGIKDGKSFWIIEGTIPIGVIDDRVRAQWLLVLGLGAFALVVALTGASLVARRMTAPMVRAVAAAEALGGGDLTASAPLTGPREVVDLGVSLNKLAGRIDRLLASERERAATLSHRLRTPLTALRLETEHLADHRDTRADERRRLRAALVSLERGLDEVINESRKTRDEGLPQQSDAVAVLRRHLDFWSGVAGARNREVHSRFDSEKSCRVPVTAVDLGTVIDAVLSNTFRHTPAGTSLTVLLERTEQQVAIRFTDGSPSGPMDDFPEGTGSTGIGLSIADGIISEAGGTMFTSEGPGGGFVVTVNLPLV